MGHDRRSSRLGLLVLVALSFSMVTAPSRSAEAGFTDGIKRLFRQLLWRDRVPGQLQRQVSADRGRLDRHERAAISQTRPRDWRSSLERLDQQARSGKGIAAALLPEKIIDDWRAGTGNYKLVTFDRGHGNARSPADRGSKFVVIESRGRRGTDPLHLLAIPTPAEAPSRGQRAPNLVWLHQVDASKASHLGRMVRTALDALSARTGRYDGVEAWINMPGGALTVGSLHVHAVPKASRPRRWDAIASSARQIPSRLDSADYGVYQLDDGSLAVIATKSRGGAGQLRSEHDALVGRMLIEASQTALSLPTPLIGQIALARDNDRLVVRVERLGKVL